MASGHERYDWGARIARRVWSSALTYRSLVRALVTSVALTAGVLLAGCNSDEISLANNAKANQPVPPKLLADMTAKDMDLNSPMLVGRPRTEGPRRRPPGAGRLLRHHAGADESAVGLLSVVQHRLSQRLRQGA